jgi:hypothetical protein
MKQEIHFGGELHEAIFFRDCLCSHMQSVVFGLHCVVSSFSGCGHGIV